MPVINDDSFERLLDSARVVSSFFVGDGWPPSGWIDDLEEVTNHSTEDLAEEGVGLHLKLASKLPAIRAKFVYNGYSLEEWLGKVHLYYETGDGVVATEVQRGAKLLYEALNDE